MRALLVLMMLLFAGGALAADIAPCTTLGSCDEGEAYRNAESYATAARYCTSVGEWTLVSKRVFKQDAYRFAAGVTCKRKQDNFQTEFLSNATHFFGPRTCANRNATYPPGDAALWYSEPPKCVGGCAITGESFSQANGGVTVYGQRDRYYTGETCAAPTGPDGIGPPDGGDKEKEGNKPKPNECTALGSGQTACAKPNGDQCATASTGKTFCWKPGQQGHQTDGNDAQGKSEKGKPVDPPPAPPGPEKEWQRTEGHQNTTCVNTTCTTYNITNFQGVGSGQSKNSRGDNVPDGSGNTSGNGSPGKGNGGGKEGDGDSATDSGNCEASPTCVGDTLKCLHLKFTWKIQCNTKGSEVSGGDGCAESDVPVCAGSNCKAEAYAQVLQQWRSRCAVQGIKSSVEGHAGQGDGDDGEGSIIIDDTGSNLSLDEGKVAYAGGQLGFNFTVQGVKFEIPQQVLDFFSILRVLIIAGATLAAIAIIRGN